MPDIYDEKAEVICKAIANSYAECYRSCSMDPCSHFDGQIKAVAAALRSVGQERYEAGRQEGRAEAYEDAAHSVECFDASLGMAECSPCDGCVMAARFRGRAAKSKARSIPSPEVTPKPCECVHMGDAGHWDGPSWVRCPKCAVPPKEAA